MHVDLRVKHNIEARKAAIELLERGHGWIGYSQSTQEGPRMEDHQGVSRGGGAMRHSVGTWSGKKSEVPFNAF